MGTLTDAHAASDALVVVHYGLAVTVHGALACRGTKAHAQILQRAANARALVALEVGQADDGVGVHGRAANERLLAVFPVDGYGNMVVAQKAIGDDDMAAGLKRAKAIFKGGGQMIQRIAAHAGVQSVAVRQEGARSHILERIHHNLGIIGTQESQVARLAKVHFDGGELAFQRHAGHTGRLDEMAQLLKNVPVGFGAEIGKINLGFFHG